MRLESFGENDCGEIPTLSLFLPRFLSFRNASKFSRQTAISSSCTTNTVWSSAAVNSCGTEVITIVSCGSLCHEKSTSYKEVSTKAGEELKTTERESRKMREQELVEMLKKWKGVKDFPNVKNVSRSS